MAACAYHITLPQYLMYCSALVNIRTYFCNPHAKSYLASGTTYGQQTDRMRSSEQSILFLSVSFLGLSLYGSKRDTVCLNFEVSTCVPRELSWSTTSMSYTRRGTGKLFVEFCGPRARLSWLQIGSRFNKYFQSIYRFRVLTGVQNMIAPTDLLPWEQHAVSQLIT